GAAAGAGGVEAPLSQPRAAPSPPEKTLLGWLQADLRANAEPDPDTRAERTLGTSDRSVQVHACHGAARQVDVLREVLVGLLEDDPTLEPRDILVMCPDIETFAPLVQAGFGLVDLPGTREGHPGHRLRLRLADRALSSTNPLLAVAATLVDLVGGRVTATEVLDLASAGPVRRRFAFDDDDLAQVAMWVEESAIRWGLDARQRAAYGLDLGDNTWASGLSRILLGVAMAEDGASSIPVLPVDDVSSADIDLAGRFGEYVDRLRRFVEAAGSASTIGSWVSALSVAVDQLTDTSVREAWLRAQFDRELAMIVDSSQAGTAASDSTPLLLADVRQLLAHRLGGRPTRANFRTGTLTVCTMVPMRSVPHRVVCLLGLDDGVFPRAGSVDGDDVLARRPVTGERDARSEDRQLFLDAILAARETLVVTYTGANEHTGADRPPAVPLGELLDALDATAVAPSRSQARSSTTGVRDRVVVRHPLQPFDARNLVPGELVPGAPFSFDQAARAGAEAMRGPRLATTALVPTPLPARAPADVALADLKAFVEHPVRAFLRQRLDVTAPLEAEETLDAIPITLDGLSKWAFGDRMLRDILAGTSPYDAAHAERLRGGLPPGALGDRVLREVDTELRALVLGALRIREGQDRGDQGRPPEQRTLDVSVDLGEGRRLTGTVGGVWGNRLVTVHYSRLAAKHRLASWVDLLALSAGRPDESWTAHAIGRGRSAPAVATAGPLDHRAEQWLRDLVDLYDRGMRQPLPLPVKTACAYAEETLKGGGSDWKARKEWTTDRFSPYGILGEDGDPSHVQVFGEDAPFEVLTGEPRDDERWSNESHRLGQLALRLWTPLLSGAER
ncbi:MAG: exodeoxyribonuclease V subunit gamma, partial [Nocardioides sp.]